MPNQESKKEIKFHLSFQSLTPRILEGDNINNYLEALKYSINHNDIKNIALTGEYGSGKSSILRTFIAKNPEISTLNISLASFNKDIYSVKEDPEEKSNCVGSETDESKSSSLSSNPNKDNFESLLELSILQQIFYHVKYDKIPDSRFKRIISLSNDYLLNYGFLFTIWFASLIYLFFPFQLNFSFAERLDHDIVKLFIILIFFTGIAKFVMHSRRIFNNSKLNKLNIQSGEIEIDKNIDQSVLNQNIDELIYFFEVNKYDAVIFEDLDRFDSPKIFSKLREINLLLNNSKQINRDVSFIYAIRDNIFKTDDRIKFFDFLIPVIPVVNSSNSFGKIWENFENTENHLVPNKRFIEEIAPFLGDMRLIYNVLNEYLIYKSNISSLEGLTSNEQDFLFSIIIYKNFYPEDFMDLNNGKGRLYSLFQEKNLLIKKAKVKKEKEIGELSIRLDKINEEKLRDLKELKVFYISALQKQLPASVGIYFDKEYKPYSDMYDLSEETFDLIIDSPKIRYHQYTQNPLTNYSSFNTVYSDFSFRQIEMEVEPNNNYRERYNIIESRSNSDRMIGELESLGAEIRDIETWKFKKLIESNEEDIISNHFKDDDLLSFLIREGYINEEYTDYISYFYPGSITATDNRFYRHILASKKMNHDYKLIKLDSLIQMIPPRFFKEDQILNYDIVQFLVENMSTYKNQYRYVLNILGNGTQLSKEFIIKYLERDIGSESFVTEISKKWGDFWSFLEKNIPDLKKLVEYKFIILKNCSLQKLDKLNINEEVKKSLENDSNFLSNYKKLEESKLKSIINHFKLKFKYLSFDKNTERNIVEYIYTNNNYIIKPKIVYCINLYLNNFSVSYREFLNKPYTLLRETNSAEYLNESINKFVESFYIKFPITNFTEEITSLAYLINVTELEDYRKKELIKRTSPIDSLGLIISKEWKEIFIKERKISPIWAVIFECFKEDDNKIEDELLSLLNDKDFINKLILNEYNVDNTLKNEIVRNGYINIDTYKILNNSFENLDLSNIDMDRLNKKHILYLIESLKLPLNIKNFNHIKSTYPELAVDLISENKREFHKVFKTLEIDEDVLKYMLEDQRITKNMNKKILENSIDITTLTNDSTKKNIAIYITSYNIKPEIEIEEFIELLKSTPIQNIQINLIVLYKSIIDENNIKSILQNTVKEIKRLTTGTKHLELNKNSMNERFGDLLSHLKICNSHDKEEYYLLIGKK